MNCHQIISGSANDGNFTFSNGNIDGYPFIAYGSGNEIIILDKEFKQIQVLSNTDAGGLNLLCLDCTKENGKIIASYGRVIFVLEPVHGNHEESGNHGFCYTWSYAHKIKLSWTAHAISWSPYGRTFLAAGEALTLWVLPSTFGETALSAPPGNTDHVAIAPHDGVDDGRGFFIGDDGIKAPRYGQLNATANNSNEEPVHAASYINETTSPLKVDQWICVWEAECPNRITQIQFSPDGQFFTTISEDDPLVKLWFEVKKSHAPTIRQTGKIPSRDNGTVTPRGTGMTDGKLDRSAGNMPLLDAVIGTFSDIDFDFLYLYHPSAVQLFEWRQTSHYMPKGTVANVLSTCCSDNVVRIWREGSNLSGHNEEEVASGDGYTPSLSEPFKMRMHHRKSKILKHLKHIRQKFHSIEMVQAPNGRVMIKKRRDKHANHHHHHLPSLGSLVSSQDLGKNWSYFSTNGTATPGGGTALSSRTNPVFQCSPGRVPQFHLVGKLDVGREFSSYMPIHWLNNKEFHFTLRSERIMFMLGQQTHLAGSDSFGDTHRSSTASEMSQDDEGSIHFTAGAGRKSPSAADLKSYGSDLNGAVATSLTPGTHPTRQPAANTPVSGVGAPSGTQQIRDVHKRINTAASSLYSMGLEEPAAGGTMSSSPPQSILLTDPLNREIEFLLKDWHQSLDILFGIHPVTGDLLVWKAEWIDEYLPGSVQQPLIAFLYYIPNAFTKGGTANARNGCPTQIKDRILLFTDHSLLYESLLSLVSPDGSAHLQNGGTSMMHSSLQHLTSSIHLEMESWSRSYFETFPLYVVTNARGGNLDLWLMNYISKEYEIPRLLNVEHSGEVFGHRHRISEIISHPILPLVMSTARYRSHSIGDRGASDNHYTSEIIIWKLQPIGPLSKSGGLRELGKVSSTGKYGFKHFSWIPSLLSPSKTTNMPGTAFVALNGDEIHLYEVWIPDPEDVADGIDYGRDEHPENGPMLGHQDSDKTITAANSISAKSLDKSSTATLLGYHGKRRQSTMLRRRLANHSRYHPAPHHTKGAVITLKQKICMTDFMPHLDGSTRLDYDVKLFHMFDSSIVSGANECTASVPGKDSTFYLVLMLETASGPSPDDNGQDDYDGDDTLNHRIIMWSVTYHPTCYDNDPSNTGEHSSMAPTIKFLLDQRMDEYQTTPDSPYILPRGVFVTTAKPATNHLSAGSLSTATPPYSLCVGCSDATLRFLECRFKVPGNDAAGEYYEWIEWAMPFAYETPTTYAQRLPKSISSSASASPNSGNDQDTKASLVKLEYLPVALACAYTGRICCAVPHFSEGPLSAGIEPGVGDDSIPQNFKVLIFECESSGGSSWILEDRLFINNPGESRNTDSAKNLDVEQVEGYNDIDNDKSNGGIIHLNWIQTEDGSHLLLIVTPFHLLLYTYVTFGPLAVNEYLKRSKETPSTAATSVDYNTGTNFTRSYGSFGATGGIEKRRGSLLAPGTTSSHHLVPSPSQSKLLGTGSRGSDDVSLSGEASAGHAGQHSLAIQMSSYFPQSGASAKWQLLYNLDLNEIGLCPSLELDLGPCSQHYTDPRVQKFQGQGRQAATVMCWVRDGAFVLSSDHALKVYSPWSPLNRPSHFQDGKPRGRSASITLAVLAKKQSSSKLQEFQRLRSADGAEQKIGSQSQLHNLMLPEDESVKKVSVGSIQIDPQDARKVALASLRSNLQAQEKTLGPHTITGIFGAAFAYSPVLPQYHPKQLAELLECGQLDRVKAILAYVTNYLSRSDRLAAMASHRSKLEHVSLQGTRNRAASIAFHAQPTLGNANRTSASTTRSRAANKPAKRAGLLLPDNTGDVGYFEVESVPPLPMFIFLKVGEFRNVDGQRTHAGGEKKSWLKKFYDRSNVSNSNSASEDEGGNGRKGSRSPSRTFSPQGSITHQVTKSRIRGRTSAVAKRNSLQPSSSGSSSDDDDSAGKPSDPADEVSNLDTVMSAQDLSTFGPDQMETLTRYLTRISLPALTSLEQMHLLALADTVAWIVGLVEGGAGISPTPQVAGSTPTPVPPLSVDSAGLRFLVSMRQYNYLLACLPPKSRKVLKYKGMSTASFAWAFHSNSQDKLIERIPPFQKGNYSWEEFRQYGIGWWLRSKSLLQAYIEKIARTAFQTNKEPLDAAVFFMMLQKKSILLGLFRSGQNFKMVDFLRNDFSQDRWKRAALKNAFALMGKQRFTEAVAFFLLGSSLKDAIEVCIKNLKDLQMALVIARLFEPPTPDQEQPVPTFAPLPAAEVPAAQTRKAPGSLIGFGRPGTAPLPPVSEASSSTDPSKPGSSDPALGPLNSAAQETKSSPLEYRATKMETELHQRFLATALNSEGMGFKSPTLVHYDALPRDPFLQSIGLWILRDYEKSLAVFLNTLSPLVQSRGGRSRSPSVFSRHQVPPTSLDTDGGALGPTAKPMRDGGFQLPTVSEESKSGPGRPSASASARSPLSGRPMGRGAFRRRLSSVTETKEAPSSFFLQMDNIYDNTSIFNFYNFLRSHYDFDALLADQDTNGDELQIGDVPEDSNNLPDSQTSASLTALLKRRMTASDILIRKGLPTKGGPYTAAKTSKSRGKIDGIGVTAKERHLYFACAYTYLKIGCPTLALEILSQMAHKMSHGSVVGVRKGAFTDGDDIFSQLKLIACLKIITNELMTTFANTTLCEDESDDYNSNSTEAAINGPEDVVGEGEPTRVTASRNQTATRMWLRFYIWLEKEFEATNQFCGDKGDIDPNASATNATTSPTSSSASGSNVNKRLYQTFGQARAQWLLKNESLLRTLYSFTCLHKPLGALAYVRMELGALLEETDRIKSIGCATSPLSTTMVPSAVSQHILPYLLRSFSSSRDTIQRDSGPLAFLRDMSRDVLLTVLDHFATPLPPIPDGGCEWDRLLTMQDTSHALAICLFQGLSPLNQGSGPTCNVGEEGSSNIKNNHQNLIDEVNFGPRRPSKTSPSPDDQRAVPSAPQSSTCPTVLYTTPTRLDEVCNSDFDVILNFWWRYYYNDPNSNLSGTSGTDDKGYPSKLLLIRETDQRSPLNQLSTAVSPVSEDMDISKWPGLHAFDSSGLGNKAAHQESIIDTMDTPAFALKLFLAEALVSIHASCFLTALATYDACLLYRIACLKFDARLWCSLFGYGHQEICVPTSSSSPPQPQSGPGPDQISQPELTLGIRKTSLSTRESSPVPPPRPAYTPKIRELFCTPKQNIFARIFQKPTEDSALSTAILDYESEGSTSSSSTSEDEEDREDYGGDDAEGRNLRARQHSDPRSFSWTLIRLAIVRLVVTELGSFLAGVLNWGPESLPAISPRIHAYLMVLEGWERGLSEALTVRPVPPLFSTLEVDEENDMKPSTDSPKGVKGKGGAEPEAPLQPAILRYKVILDPAHTPFSTHSRVVLPVKRLWLRLVRDERTHDVFVRYIFRKNFRGPEINTLTGQMVADTLQPHHRAATGLNLKSEAIGKLAKRASQTEIPIQNGSHDSADNSVFAGPATRFSARGNPLAIRTLSKHQSPLIFSILQKDREPIQCFAMKSKFIYSSSLDSLVSSSSSYQSVPGSADDKSRDWGDDFASGTTHNGNLYADDCFFYPRTDMLALASGKEVQEMDIHQALSCPQWVMDDTELDIYSSRRKLSRSEIDYLIVPNENVHHAPNTPIHPKKVGHSDSPVTNKPESGSLRNPIPKIHLVLKRNELGVRKIVSHPLQDYYITAGQDSFIKLWKWGDYSHIAKLSSLPTKLSAPYSLSSTQSTFPKINGLRYSAQGSKFGAMFSDGRISLFNSTLDSYINSDTTYWNNHCHNRIGNDFTFMGCSSLICTAGLSQDNKNLCLWDTLLPERSSCIHSFVLSQDAAGGSGTGGVSAVEHAPVSNSLVATTKKGHVCVIDLRMRKVRYTFQAHDSGIRCLAVNPSEEYYVTGSPEGNIKVWSLSLQSPPMYTFNNEHFRTSLFRSTANQGVFQVYIDSHNRVYSCGADGTLKVRKLPEDPDDFSMESTFI